MNLRVTARLEFQLPADACDFLLQIEAAHLPEQTIVWERLTLSPSEHEARVGGLDQIGERVWLRAAGPFLVDYAAEIAINRVLRPVETLDALPPHLLPGAVVPYLMDSAYCPASRFERYVEDPFGSLCGGARIMAMRDWIAENFTYEPGASSSATTALDSILERRGVCRDFAHVLITLARASGIPARYASVYGPNVSPQDFHAVAEVFLANPEKPGGGWHLVDPTLMGEAGEFAKIGIGRDAADASFLTSYGPLEVRSQAISAYAVPDPA